MGLEAIGLKKAYKKRTVVNGVSIKVNKGEIVGLLGPNGAGKTTTFYMIVGIVRPDDGMIKLGNDDLTKLPMHARSQRGIGYLPQEPSIFRKMTVTENIKAALEMRFTDKTAIRERTEKLIEDFNLQKVYKTYGYELSGGERRRVEVARCLAVDPDFILLDEPYAGIDPISVHDIQDMVFELKKMGIGTLITDHNVRETLKITDRAYIISEGQVLTEGLPADIIRNDAVIEKYLGKGFSIE